MTGISAATPVWLSLLLTLVTLAGVLASAVLLRRTGKEGRVSAEELDRRGKREETMRTLRWAAEHAARVEVRSSRLGIAVLDTLGQSSWLEAADQAVIDAATSSVTATPSGDYRGRGEASIFVARDEPSAGGGSGGGGSS